jgi:hypothetical protein
MMMKSGHVSTAMAHGVSGITAQPSSIYLMGLTFKDARQKFHTSGW